MENENVKFDKAKCEKLKRFLIIAAIVTVGILSWRLYEYLNTKHEELPVARDPYNLLQLTEQLYEEETKRNPYLFKVNVQGKTRASSNEDHAAKPLFELHNDLLAVDSTSTVSLMRRLYDNYELDVNVMERVTDEERQEELDFLRAVMNTRIMKLTMRNLVDRNLVANDNDAQLSLLHEIWFTPYSRGNRILSSSGFEHVFLAEVRDNNVLGLHNWIYFAEQEQQGHINYKGWMDRVDLTQDTQFLLMLSASFMNANKRYSSLLIGTSPELELSLYTLCFMTHKEKEICSIKLNNKKINIITHAWNWHGKRLMGSAYAAINKD